MAKHARDSPPYCQNIQSHEFPAEYPPKRTVLIFPHQYMELPNVLGYISVKKNQHNLCPLTHPEGLVVFFFTIIFISGMGATLRTH